MKKAENVVAQSMRAGFTLMELMIAVAIVGILSTVAVQSLTGNIAKANEAAAKQGVNALKEACTTYYINHKKMPTSLDQLVEGDEPALENGESGLYDPWGLKYEMEKKGKNVIIKSAGPDGEWGTDDDIRSDDKMKKSSKSE